MADFLEAELKGILSPQLEDAELQQRQERVGLLKQSIADAQQEIVRIAKQLELLDIYTQARKQLVQCEENEQEANKAYAAFNSKRQRVELFDYIFPIHGLYHEIRILEQHLEYLKSEEETLGREVRIGTQATDNTRAQLNVAIERLANNKEQRDLRIGDIHSGFETQGIISALQLQLHTYEQQLRQQQLSLHEREDELHEKRQQEAVINNDYEQAELHHKTLSVHALMLDHYDLLKEKMAAFEYENNRNEKAHAEHAELVKQRESLLRIVSEAEHQRGEMKDKITALRNELNVHQQANNGHDDTELLRRQSETQNQVTLLTSAKQCWKRITNGYEFIYNNEIEVVRIQNELRVKRPQLQEIKDDMSLHVTVANLEGALEKLEKYLADRKLLLDADLEEWKRYAHLDAGFSDSTPTVNREARAMQIEMHIINATRSAEDTQHELDIYMMHQREINRINESISNIELQLHEKSINLDDMRIQLRVTESKMQELERTMRESDRIVSQLYIDLDKMITLSGWFTEWQHNPDSIRTRINELYHDWQSTSSLMESLTRQRESIRKEVAHSERIVSDNQRQEILARNNRDMILHQIEDAKEKIRTVFGESSPRELEQNLRDQVAEAETTVGTTREEYETIFLNQQSVVWAKERNIQGQQFTRQHLQEKNAQLDLWIDDHNDGTHLLQRSIVEDIFNDHCDWNALRAEDIALLEETNKAKILLEEARQHLLDVQNDGGGQLDDSGTQSETLHKKSEQLSAEIARWQDELHEVEGSIAAHEIALMRAERFKRHNGMA